MWHTILGGNHPPHTSQPDPLLSTLVGHDLPQIQPRRKDVTISNILKAKNGIAALSTRLSAGMAKELSGWMRGLRGM
jgi:hypothetical protein